MSEKSGKLQKLNMKSNFKAVNLLQLLMKIRKVENYKKKKKKKNFSYEVW